MRSSAIFRLQRKRKSLIIKIIKETVRRHIKRYIRRYFYPISVICIICIIIIYKVLSYKNEDSNFQPLHSELNFDHPSERYNISFQFNMPNIEAERRDWHDYATMADDEKRIGPGEYGKPTVNKDKFKKYLEKLMIQENNFNALISEIISVNRSVPKVQEKMCLKKQYLAKLPTVSIVISCRNEFYSVLQRSLHSIVNRTPKELLKEIIIVDDYSSRGYTLSEMMLYTQHHFPNLVKFLRLPKRKGLMYVRVAGAKLATGNVLVFLDSHIECNHNWLPPLLEPIAINDRITTAPIIDRIDHETFEYVPSDGTRGGFTWYLDYTLLRLHNGPDIDETKPYKDAIMMGGLFAISRRFFWELGGYDLGLDTWGGEQFELSFKIWMCGGMLLVIPCSRVGHIFAVPLDNKRSPKDKLSIQKNKKRVAEVWMDEYKHYVYSINPELFYSLDVGNLTAQHALRKSLKCKSFKWFLDFVAPDFKNEHPFDLPPDFANGTLESVAFSNFCLDIISEVAAANVGFHQCSHNRQHPAIYQNWNFNFRQEVKNFIYNQCLDASDSTPNVTVKMYTCHKNAGNQFWFYDKSQKLLFHGQNNSNCLEVLKFESEFRVVLNECDAKNKGMKWIFGYVSDLLISQRYFLKDF